MPATRRNLEITHDPRAATTRRRCARCSTTCATAAGSRLLRQWLTPAAARPGAALRRATTPSTRSARRRAPRRTLREALRSDGRRRAHRRRASRCAARGRATSRGCATRWPRCPTCTRRCRLAAPIARCDAARSALRRDPQWRALLARAIAAEPAALLRDGGVIAAGYDAELDELRAHRRQLRRVPASSSRRASARAPASRTSRSSTTACTASTSRSRNAQSDKVPDDYRRRQTLKNAERYITPELKTFEDKALSAQERALAREKRAVRRAARRARTGDPASLQAVAARARAARRARQPRRARRRAATRASAIRRRARHRDRRRPPSGRRAAGRRPSSPTTSCSTPIARLLDRHRAEHGRQVDVHAPDGGDRAARAIAACFVPGGARDARTARRDLHAHRRRRRPRRRPLDVHGRDDRGRVHPESRDARRASC